MLLHLIIKNSIIKTVSRFNTICRITANVNTEENLLDSLNTSYCLPSAISDQHNNSVIRFSSNLHEYYSEYLCLSPNQAELIDINNTRITDFSQLDQFYQYIIDSSIERIDSFYCQKQDSDNNFY